MDIFIALHHFLEIIEAEVFGFFFTFSQATSHTHTPCNSQFLSVNSKNQAKCFLFFSKS